MSPHIVIHWIGIRKDSGKGSIWGWFTEANKPDVPTPKYSVFDYPPNYCHIFWGKLGKKIYINKVELTYDFISELKVKQKNYKQTTPEKVLSRWGKNCEEEFSMYLLMLKMMG